MLYIVITLIMLYRILAIKNFDQLFYTNITKTRIVFKNNPKNCY